jgi:hypothetical protein
MSDETKTKTEQDDEDPIPPVDCIRQRMKRMASIARQIVASVSLELQVEEDIDGCCVCVECINNAQGPDVTLTHPNSGYFISVMPHEDGIGSRWGYSIECPCSDKDQAVVEDFIRKCDVLKGFDVFWAYAAVLLQTYADKRKQQKEKGTVEQVD